MTLKRNEVHPNRNINKKENERKKIDIDERIISCQKATQLTTEIIRTSK